MKILFIIISILCSSKLFSQQIYYYPIPEKKFNLNIVNRFSGVSFFGNNVSTSKPFVISTTMIEFTYGVPHYYFHSAFRISTPIESYQPDNSESLIAGSTRLGFALGAGFSIGDTDPNTKKRNSFNIIPALVFEFGIYNPYRSIDESSPGGFLWGWELMLRYHAQLSRKTFFVIGLDIGYHMANNISRNHNDYRYPLIDLKHMVIFGGIVGLRF